MSQVVFSVLTCKAGFVSQQNEMKSFVEKLNEVANVSYLSDCKLNSVDPDVKKGWSILGGPWTRSRWWSMDWGSVLCIYPQDLFQSAGKGL